MFNVFFSYFLFLSFYNFPTEQSYTSQPPGSFERKTGIPLALQRVIQLFPSIHSSSPPGALIQGRPLGILFKLFLDFPRAGPVFDGALEARFDAFGAFVCNLVFEAAEATAKDDVLAIAYRRV